MSESKASELKAELDSLYTKMTTLAKENAPDEDMCGLRSSSTDAPHNIAGMATRRTLKGHFGKVYACNFGGAAQDNTLASAAQDGFGQGKVYPDGPWRPRSGVQRGSIQVLAAATTRTNTYPISTG